MFDLYTCMTRTEQERLKNHLDQSGPLLLGLIGTSRSFNNGTIEQKLGLLAAFYMYEVRKVDWSTLCINAHIWDEIKRDMQLHPSVYYKTGTFSDDALVHNINALYALLEASKQDAKTFNTAFLMFKLALV